MNKPRLSMKLLWRFSNQYHNESKDPRTIRLDKVTDFIDFVEKQMKSNDGIRPKTDNINI